MKKIILSLCISIQLPLFSVCIGELSDDYAYIIIHKWIDEDGEEVDE
jgi:hypothetical protein